MKSTETPAKKDAGEKMKKNALEQIGWLKHLMPQRSKFLTNTVIIRVKVDTTLGRPLADELCPNTNWQTIRDSGRIPFVEGTVDRVRLMGMLATVDEHATTLLQEVSSGPTIVLVENDTIEVYSP